MNSPDGERTHALKAEAPANACGGCKQCCITFRVVTELFTKPSHQPCDHCSQTGCKIYRQRPQACREFECVWLQSQRRNDRMPPELRPDRCGVFFVDYDSTSNKNPLLFEVHTSYVGAEDNPHVVKYIEEMLAAGWKGKVITSYEGEEPWRQWP